MNFIISLKLSELQLEDVLNKVNLSVLLSHLNDNCRNTENIKNSSIQLENCDSNSERPKIMTNDYFKKSKEIKPTVSNESFFINFPTFSNSYIVYSFYSSVHPTYFEQDILNDYFLFDQNFGKEKDINLNSKLVSLLIDFARFYYARH